MTKDCSHGLARQKQLLRLDFRKKLSALSAQMRQRLSQDLCQRFLKDWQRQPLGDLAVYMPFGFEVNLYPCWLELSRCHQLYVPRVTGKQIQFAPLPSVLLTGDLSDIPDWSNRILPPGWQLSAYGILEPPLSACVPTPEVSAIVVPCLGVDEKGYRLGYGGGYYDRFLNQYPQWLRLLLCYDQQLVPALPTETHDLAVDAIWTPTKCYRFHPSI